MSRTWSRARITEHCGLCTAAIPAGDPLVRVTVPNVRRALLRCVACVGPAPPDLPALIEQREATPITWTPMKNLVHTVDFRKRAAGDER